MPERKVVRLTVSRKQFTEITVTVPHDFQPERLRPWWFDKVIREAVDELDPEFDTDFDERPEVEQVKTLSGDEAAKELKDYPHFAITEEHLAQVQAEQEQRAKEFMALKQQEAKP